MPNLKTILRQAAKPFLFLLTMIFICAFLAHYLTGDETLLEYAQNNPELAYGTPESGISETEALSENESPAQNEAQNNMTNSVNQTSQKATSLSDVPQNGDTADIQAKDAAVTPDKSGAYTDTESKTADNSGITLPNNEADTPESAKETDAMTPHTDRTTYEDGFYYEPLTDAVKDRITGISYPESGCTVPYEDLRYVGLKYIDFDGQTQTGELICNKAIAQDMTEIFYELYRNEYRLARVRLIDEYDGDDTASMADNNTSCFNYRVVDGTDHLSKHAYGLAIDINPYYNPYVVFGKNADGSDYISPPGSEIYADRSKSFAYKIDENDLCYRLFTERGFTWGGNWNSTKDYQHFQKALN